MLRLPPGCPSVRLRLRAVAVWRTATRDTEGTASLRSASRLATRSLWLSDSPVTRPPGHERVVASPDPIGSGLATKTTGRLAARRHEPPLGNRALRRYRPWNARVPRRRGQANTPTEDLFAGSFLLPAPRPRAARRRLRPATSPGSGGGPSFDHVLRAQQQRRRDRETERLGGLEVDHELELRRLLDGRVGGLSALARESPSIVAQRRLPRAKGRGAPARVTSAPLPRDGAKRSRRPSRFVDSPCGDSVQPR
jgi:hypothetical protein